MTEESFQCHGWELEETRVESGMFMVIVEIKLKKFSPMPSVFSNAFSFLSGNANYNHNEKLFPFIRLAESKEMSHMLQW